jgi:hypothetical protein
MLQHDVHDPDTSTMRLMALCRHSYGISDLLINALKPIFLSVETKLDPMVRQHQNARLLQRGLKQLHAGNFQVTI